MSDPVNGSDEAVEALRRVTDEALKRLEIALARPGRSAGENWVIASFAAAVRAEAVADERRRTERALELLDEWIEGGELVAWAMAVRDVLAPESAPQSTELSRSIYASFEADLAAGSVPVATPGPTYDNVDSGEGEQTEPYEDVPEGFHVVDDPDRGEMLVPNPVVTPSAEPAQAEPMVGIFDVIAVQQNYRRHLLSLDPSPEVRAALDEAIPAPSQPVTCEHGQSASHYTTVISGLCPGPVSVPKESSE